MALSLYAVNEGYIDDVDVAKVGDFEAALHDYARGNHGDLLDKINESGDYNDEIEGELKGVMEAFSEKGAY
ncbi:MAG: F0F1 ATP synthase subunit alpha, partial [Gammaproteobacteria bacterium]